MGGGGGRLLCPRGAQGVRVFASDCGALGQSGQSRFSRGDVIAKAVGERSSKDLKDPQEAAHYYSEKEGQRERPRSKVPRVSQREFPRGKDADLRPMHKGASAGVRTVPP